MLVMVVTVTADVDVRAPRMRNHMVSYCIEWEGTLVHELGHAGNL